MPNLSETPSVDGEQRCDDPALAAGSELLGPRKGASIYGPIETSGACCWFHRCFSPSR